MGEGEGRGEGVEGWYLLFIDIRHRARVSKMKKPMRLHTYLTRTRNLDMVGVALCI